MRTLYAILGFILGFTLTFLGLLAVEAAASPYELRALPAGTVTDIASDGAVAILDAGTTCNFVALGDLQTTPVHQPPGTLDRDCWDVDNGIGFGARQTAGWVEDGAVGFDRRGTVSDPTTTAFAPVIGAPGGNDLEGRLLAIDGSGTFAVGWSTVPDVCPGFPFWATRHAVYWDGGPAVVDLGVPAGSDGCAIDALGVNDHGTVTIVGQDFGLGGVGTYAFTWTSLGGIQRLPDLAGGPVWGRGWDVSDDGTYVAGQAQDDTTRQAVRWTNGGAPEVVGSLGPGCFGEAYGISCDGKRIVGYSCNEPFIWEEGTGTLNLEPYLNAIGAAIPGLDMGAVRGISCDGLTVVGDGTPTPWVLELPAGPLGLDTDSDGVPDPLDNCTERANPAQEDCNDDGFGDACDCDFNDNGACDGDDYIAFSGVFGQYVPPASTCYDMIPNGSIDGNDYIRFTGGFGGVPGPSGLHP